MLNATQIRAARAILNWPQSELARQSSISLATIRKIETDTISPRNSTMEAIYNVLYAAGIEFIEPDGVRRRPSDLFIYEGRNGGKDFFEDLRRTTTSNGGDIYIVSPNATAFAKYCGLTDILDLDALVDANKTVEIKCLLTDATDVPLSTPRFRFRTISKNFVNPVPFCAYGQKYAIAVPNGEPFSKLIVVEASKMASTARQHFLSLWDKATMSGQEAQEPVRLRAV